MALFLSLFLFLDYNLALTLLCVFVVIYSIHLIKFYAGTPPGPWGLPVFGYLFFLSKKPYEDFVRFAKKYGDVFSIKIGARYVIILNDYDVIKEAFVKDGDFYAGKPKDGIEAMLGDHKSIFVTEGEVWKEQRRFVLSTMRNFGLGKSKLEEHLCDEAEIAVKELVKTNGSVFNIYQLIKKMTSNSIAYFIYGRRLTADDKRYIQIIDQIMGDSDSEFAFTSIKEAFPFFETLFEKCLKLGFWNVKSLKEEFDSFSNKIIEEHEETFDKNNIRDITDAYLQKQRALKMERNSTSLFSKDYLLPNILLFFTAGTDTTSSMLSWAFKLLAEFQEIQKRLQDEIDDVIGRTRAPTMADKIKMPFTEATILEVHRFVSLVPLTFYHKITGDTILKGYKIPKNAFVLANLWNVHHDPEIWKEPNKFNPERFLDKNGIISNLRERVVAFSVGKRNCLGESLAKMEIFIFLTFFLQKFTFNPPEGESWDLKPDVTIPLIKLKKFNICAVERK